MKKTVYSDNSEKSIKFEAGVNFWPSFVDVIASVLMIFILISFVRLVLNIETLDALMIRSQQDEFSKEFQAEFHKEMEEEKIRSINKGNLQELTFSSEILFSAGSAELSYQGIKLLERLAIVFYKTMSTANFRQIQVEGHTDSTPISRDLMKKYPTNWELSSQRAINVCQFFINKETLGFEPKLFSATGYSFNKPVAPNDNEANRAKNRRIEIRLVYFTELTETINEAIK